MSWPGCLMGQLVSLEDGVTDPWPMSSNFFLGDLHFDVAIFLSVNMCLVNLGDLSYFGLVACERHTPNCW